MRMGVDKTMASSSLTTRINSCLCGSRFESMERITRRLQSSTGGPPVDTGGPRVLTGGPPVALGSISSSQVLNLSLPCLPDPDQTPGRAKRGKSRQYSTGFETAWKTYGRGEGKFAAFRAWEIEAEMVGGDQILLDLILAALKWQAPIFAADGWKFAPHFERYLKRKRWTDERPPSGRDATKGWAPPAPATAHVGGKVTW